MDPNLKCDHIFSLMFRSIPSLIWCRMSKSLQNELHHHPQVHLWWRWPALETTCAFSWWRGLMGHFGGLLHASRRQNLKKQKNNKMTFQSACHEGNSKVVKVFIWLINMQILQIYPYWLHFESEQADGKFSHFNLKLFKYNKTKQSLNGFYMLSILE